MRQIIVILIIGLSLSRAAVALAKSSKTRPTIPIPDSIRATRDIAYRTNATMLQTLDVYQAKTQPAMPQPTLVFIHGGGFVGGDKDNVLRERGVISELIGRNVTVISLNYRLVSDGKTSLLDCVRDCQEALRFIGMNACNLRVDTNRIAVWGQSAGGHLALMCALAPQLLTGQASYPVPVCAVDYYGPADFTDPKAWAGRTKDDPRSAEAQQAIFRCTLKENPGLFSNLSPICHLTPSGPPLLVVHGMDDTTVPFIQSRRFVARAQSVGSPVTLLAVTNAAHGFSPRPGKQPVTPPHAEIEQRTTDFLIHNLSLATRAASNK